MTESESGTARTPYELIGGEHAVRQLVDRFYDLMDTAPEAAGIRPPPIGEEERDAWIRCMDQALDEQEMPEQLRAFLRERFRGVADHMRNQPSGSSGREGSERPKRAGRSERSGGPETSGEASRSGGSERPGS